MSIEYEPAPKPTPLWMLPLIVGVVALALLWFLQSFTNRDTGGFGGRAQPDTPMPNRLVDGSGLPEVPEPLARRFGEDVVLARRIDQVPEPVEQRCRHPYDDQSGPALTRIQQLIDSSAPSAAQLGPDALTYLSIAVADTPPGYPREIAVACVAQPGDDGGWSSASKPYLDFALDGRPGARMEKPLVRTRLVQVPVGARWAVQPRGGWWLAYDVRDTSWVLMTLIGVIHDDDPLRVTFVDETGALVAERPVGPTRAAALGDHSADFELIAGDVPDVLDRLENGPLRVCEQDTSANDNTTVCVWLAFNELQEIQAFAAYGPHQLDTPPMGFVGYCPEAEMFQGSVTTAQFGLDGSWAGGPINRGLDRYAVRFEAGKVVIDLSEHVNGDPAEGDPVEGEANCVFATKAVGEPG
jgi:hypothetical protein